MSKIQPEETENNFQTDGEKVKINDINGNNALVIDEGEKKKFTQELNFYIIPVMVMYNHRSYPKMFKYRVTCITLFMILSHMIMIIMFKDIFVDGAKSLDFVNNGLFSLITRKSKASNRRLFETPTAYSPQFILPNETEFFLKYKDNVVKKFKQIKRINKLQMFMQQQKFKQIYKQAFSRMNSTRILQTTYFDPNFCNLEFDSATDTPIDQAAYDACISSLLGSSLSTTDLSTIDWGTVDLSNLSSSSLDAVFQQDPTALLDLSYDQLQNVDFNTLNLSDAQLTALFSGDASIPYGTDMSDPSTLKYYLTTEPFNLSNQSQVAQMASINADAIIQSNPKTADQSRGDLNQQVILVIVKICGIFMAFYMSAKKSAEGNHTHLFFYILEKKTSKAKKLGNFFGYYEIAIGFILYITTFFVILGEDNSIELIKDIAGLCILTDLDQWMSEYLLKNKEFMNIFEKPIVEKYCYGYEDGAFSQEITPSEEIRYYQEHKKSVNTIMLRIFEFINDFMTMGMAGIVIAASQTMWK